MCRPEEATSAGVAMTPGLCLPVLGNSACLDSPTLMSVVRRPGLRQTPFRAAFEDSTACPHSRPSPYSCHGLFFHHSGFQFLMASCGIGSPVSPAHPPGPPAPFCSPTTPSCISCQSDGSALDPSFSAWPTSPHLWACFQTAGLPRQEEEGEVPGHCSSLRAQCSAACQNSGGSNHYLCLFLSFLSPLAFLSSPKLLIFPVRSRSGTQTPIVHHCPLWSDAVLKGDPVCDSAHGSICRLLPRDCFFYWHPFSCSRCLPLSVTAHCPLPLCPLDMCASPQEQWLPCGLHIYSVTPVSPCYRR